jgi:pimeloyl-ACP methyl ester carboxylesterase
MFGDPICGDGLRCPHHDRGWAEDIRLTIPVLEIGGEFSLGAGVGGEMKLVADNVQTAVIPGAGHFVAEDAPTEMLAALTMFLAPYHESASTQQAVITG